jgi:hypothetical protein
MCAFVARLNGAEAAIDFEQPKLLTGTIYETSSGTNKILFTFKRTSTRSNNVVLVLRDFSYPNGSLAAREEIAFQDGQLLWSKLDERQTGAHGRSVVHHDTKNPAKLKLFFDWTTGAERKTKTDIEDYQPNTLVGDMIPYFIVAHWNELTRGAAVNFRFIAQSRLETVGFKLVKEEDVTWRGKAAVRLRMEASNLIIAQIVDPLFFIVEKDGAHRVLEYIGRTTPKARDGSKWKDLDARTIYDWN